MQQAEAVGLYERALELSGAMLEAARASDWDALVDLERQRGRLLDRLKAEDREPGRDAAVRERKAELIRSILVLDAEVQSLTLDWMHELRDILGSASKARQVKRAYGG